MKKSVLVGIYIVFHLFVLREVRTSLFEYQIGFLVHDTITNVEHLSISKIDSCLIYPEYQSNDFRKIWH